MKTDFKQLLIKISIFIVLFVIISFIIGQKIVASNLLYGFKIFIYGGMGKILLFSIVGFTLVYREKLKSLKNYKQELKDKIFLILSFLSAVAFYILELNIEKINITLINIVLIHFLFLSIFIFLTFGVFSFNFIRDFIVKFKKELTYFLIFGVVVYSLMYLVWDLWPYLSMVILKIVYFLLKEITPSVRIIPRDMLVVKDFAVIVGEACSGIYSIFIFSSIYLFIVFLDWKKMNKTKALWVFLPAVIGAFFVNVFRVFLLMIIGGYYSKTIALGLYHSYTGMIFFLIYFTIFWLLAYKWMKR